MSSLEAASQRLETAVARLESMIGSGGVRRAGLTGSEDQLAALGREVDLLGVECDSLRRALEAAETRNRRLSEATYEVADRLDHTIDELSVLVEG
jgi:hypothetical protein